MHILGDILYCEVFDMRQLSLPDKTAIRHTSVIETLFMGHRFTAKWETILTNGGRVYSKSFMQFRSFRDD